jgi:pentapeptide MXKDX repeat protein
MTMTKTISTLVAAVFAAMTLTPAAFAQDQKKEQVHKGTAEQGTVQKKEQQKAQKKDGTGGQMKKGDAK